MEERRSNPVRLVFEWFKFRQPFQKCVSCCDCFQEILYREQGWNICGINIKSLQNCLAATRDSRVMSIINSMHENPYI